MIDEHCDNCMIGIELIHKCHHYIVFIQSPHNDRIELELRYNIENEDIEQR